MPISVIACGGRHYANTGFLYLALDYLHARRHVGLLIEGGQTGADRLARNWAVDRGVPFVTEDADWKRLGHQAGPVRNGRMLAMHGPQGVVAFPGNRGTSNMVELAEACSVPVWFPARDATLLALAAAGQLHSGG